MSLEFSIQVEAGLKEEFYVQTLMHGAGHLFDEVAQVKYESPRFDGVAHFDRTEDVVVKSHNRIVTVVGIGVHAGTSSGDSAPDAV
ncbi:MAG: hypothetical protein R3C10_18845 [Pirellulales bacterium]